MSNYINDYQLTATCFMTIDAKYKFGSDDILEPYEFRKKYIF